jgi:pyridoxal phosphate enzyme (YggS family)
LVEIISRITDVRGKIEDAAQKAGRSAEEIKLMGVSKFHPVEMMIEAANFVDILGENRVQEAAAKRVQWQTRKSKTPWHLIGHLQRNKARKALEIFDLIESVDTLDLARVLDRILVETGVEKYPVFIEVNMSKEISKEGVEPEEAGRLLERIIQYCPHLSVEGLMTIGPNVEDEKAIRKAFTGLREMRETMRKTTGLALPELSMGMSNDFPIAIEEGSTIVRVGTAIFGPRDYPQNSKA